MLHIMMPESKCEVWNDKSFSCDVSKDGLAKISVYVHVKNECNIPEATVRTWIFDDRIRGEIE